MATSLTSNEAQIRDLQKVREISDNYENRNVEILLDEEKSTLAMKYENEHPDLMEWPEALHRDRWPTKEQFPDEEAWHDAWDELYEDKGKEGFLALLRDLARYLESPLVVLFTDWDSNGLVARVWNVQPGVKELEVLEALLSRDMPIRTTCTRL